MDWIDSDVLFALFLALSGLRDDDEDVDRDLQPSHSQGLYTQPKKIIPTCHDKFTPYFAPNDDV